MIRLSASILAADFGRLGDAVREAQEAGVDWIHLDVMDGRFVPNLTMGPDAVAAAARHGDLPLDVHLMVAEPAPLLEAFAGAGADRIGVHVEADPHLHRTVARIRELGCLPTVVLNPATPAAALTEILPDVAMVLAMTVDPGFAGQDFVPGVLPKIRRLRAMIDEGGHDVLLQVDGGLDPRTAPEVVAAGADVLVCGSAIFNDRPAAENVRALREAVQPHDHARDRESDPQS